jgi:ADP-ribose pyrophosphatase
MIDSGIRRDERFRRLHSETALEGKHLRVSRSEVCLPNGHVHVQDLVHLPSVVAILPLLGDPERGTRVVLVEQFRSSVEGYIHEVPAGHVDVDPASGREEAIEDSARRELREETGYAAGKLTLLATRLATPGISVQRVHFFLAEELSWVGQALEAAECLRVVTLPLRELLEEVLLGPRGHARVVDTKTHLTLLHTALLKGWRFEGGRLLEGGS